LQFVLKDSKVVRKRARWCTFVIPAQSLPRRRPWAGIQSRLWS
jgi:hypothetical protein